MKKKTALLSWDIKHFHGRMSIKVNQATLDFFKIFHHLKGVKLFMRNVNLVFLHRRPHLFSLRQ